MLTFLYPWLAISIVAPLLVRLWLPPRVIRSVAVRVPFLSRIKNAGGETNQIQQKSSLILPLIIWLFVVAALMRPQWLEEPIERVIPTRDLLLIVDLSGSMDHEDFNNQQGENVNRLTAVKEVLGEFLTRRTGDRVGLVVFGNAPFLQVPLTTDLELSRQLLNETAVGMAGPRTAFGDAIGLGIKILEEGSSPEKTIIALTDGNDTSSSVPPEQAARVARDRGITIHTVAIGDPTTVGEAPLDEGLLKEVAETSTGKYFLALDSEQLNGIYEELNQIETTETKTVSHRPRRALYFWPLGCAFLLSILRNAIRIVGVLHIEESAKSKHCRLRVNTSTFDLETIEQ